MSMEKAKELSACQKAHLSEITIRGGYSDKTHLHCYMVYWLHNNQYKRPYDEYAKVCVSNGIRPMSEEMYNYVYKK